MALPTLENIKAYLQEVSNLREAVRAAKQYFAGENDFLTALVAYYLDQGGVGGGGGGGGTDTEYFLWRVIEPDATLGLVFNNYVRQAVVSGAADTWRKVGASTNLASAPDSTKLEPAGVYGRVRAFSMGEVSVGAGWGALTPGACNEIALKNTSAVAINYRVGVSAVFDTLPAGQQVSQPCLANSDEWQVQRTDGLAATVTVKFMRYTK